MTFYQDGEFTASCIQAECSGQMELEMDDPPGSSTVDVDCPKCGLKYTFKLNNWEDTPEDERSLTLYL